MKIRRSVAKVSEVVSLIEPVCGSDMSGIGWGTSFAGHVATYKYHICDSVKEKPVSYKGAGIFV